MKRSTKILIGVFAGAIGLIAAFVVFFFLLWSGALNRFDARDIESFQHPDGTYTLIFQQLGDPEWPFGETDVRLVLKGKDQKKIESVETTIQNDGAQTSEMNIGEPQWQKDYVEVTLYAAEMDPKTLRIPYQ